MNLPEAGFEKNSKVQIIIEVAQKRFGLYGLEKTSMQEIANDINLSKGSLYYYFPDKESLYKAVIEKEQNEFLSKISETMLGSSEPELLVEEYAKARQEYFRTLLNLGRLRLETYSDLKPLLRESFSEFKEKEKEILKTIFIKGIKRGIFAEMDTDKTAILYLDLLRGLRLSIVNNKKTLFIEQDEYDSLLENTILFTRIFINGLLIK